MYSLLHWFRDRWFKFVMGLNNGRGSNPVARRSPLRSPIRVALVVALWSVVLGWGLAQASVPNSSGITLASLDVVPERFQLGEQIFQRECSSCHIAPSPAVLPTQSWARILVQSQHYGTQITPLQSPVLDLVWNYLQFASRPLRANEEEEDVPLRLRDSRFFYALHPQVDVPQPVSLAGCVTCHPGARDYNYRQLSPEWTAISE